MRPFSTSVPRVLAACLVALLVALLSARGQERTVTQDDVTLHTGCGRECPSYNFDGTLLQTTGEGNVASPLETTYSVHHRLGAVVSGQHTCFLNVIGTGDDIVTFDGLAETVRTLSNGVVPVVNEVHEYQIDGTRYLRIDTASQNGADLFPSGVQSGGVPLVDACFTIGLDDPLDWEGVDNVNTAAITFFKDGVPLVEVSDITPLFSDPWDGFLNVVLPGGAGDGIDAVRLEIRIFKDVDVPNDDCVNRIPVSDGTYAFSTIGATTDGVPHPQQCALGSGFPDIGQDIWFAYTATCNGELTVDLCDSQYDTKVAVYQGCGRCPPTADPIACSDDFCFLRSFLPDPDGGSVPVTLGNCYTIRVGGFQAEQGNGVLRLQCNEVAPQGACCAGGLCTSPREEPECLKQGGDWFEGEDCETFECPIVIPSHDECENCITLQTGVPFVGSTVNATGEDISSCTQSDFQDVWHCWTADCSGVVTFETCGGPDPSFDTSLSLFDGCEGTEIACNDDGGCNLHSRIFNLPVTQGTTYRLRVAGRTGAAGQYRVLVNPCRSACCTEQGQCFAVTAEQCLNGGGFPQLPGTLCQGDADQNFIDDACELCPGPPTSIAPGNTSIDPPNNSLDARQPHPPDSAAIRQGFGTTTEPVRILMVPQLAELENCFALCETQGDPVFGPNDISSVTYQGSGIYRIVLDRAISAGAASTFQYLGDQSFRTLINHPANVDGNTVANAADITKLLNCCLGDGSCSAPFTASQVTMRCDINRSGANTPLDLLRLVDLLVGSEDYLPWNGTVRPSATGICP